MKGKESYRLATENDLDLLVEAGESIFDHPVNPERTLEFFHDPRHHLMLAIDDEKVIGFASGFHYVHPDKNPQLFINEVSVLKTYRNRGVGSRLVKHLFDYAKNTWDCSEAWIGTEVSNHAARKCYQKAGGKEDSEPFILIEFH